MSLPHFLTGNNMDQNHPFPHHHLPYDFASSSSTESDSDDDELTGLTRRFTRSVSFQHPLNLPHPQHKKRVFSSPTTPFHQANENSWDLIYAAAEQVAMMKLKMKTNAVLPNRGFLKAPLSHHHYLPNPIRSENKEIFRQQQFRRSIAGDCNGRCSTAAPPAFRQSAWPPLPVENHHRRQPPVLAGGGVKKERAGTGVFLPRNYCTIPPEPKKKPAGISQPFNNMGPTIAPPQTTIRAGFAPPYQLPPPPLHFKRDELAELLTARRNAVMLAHQRRSTTLTSMPENRTGPPEVVLPQEWTY